MATYREGGRVTIGGQEFIVPKATLRVAQRVAEVQRSASGGSEMDGFQASATVLHMLLEAANPGLTVDQLLDIVDLDQTAELLIRAQTLAGFIRASPGEAERP